LEPPPDPGCFTDTQAAQLAKIKRTRGGIWRAYEMKEQFRAIFAGDLDRDEAAELLDRWCARAQRCRLDPFIKAARTMRQRRDLILNAVEHGISNGRVEGLNTKLRLIVRRAYGTSATGRRSFTRALVPQPSQPTAVASVSTCTRSAASGSSVVLYSKDVQVGQADQQGAHACSVCLHVGSGVSKGSEPSILRAPNPSPVDPTYTATPPATPKRHLSWRSRRRKGSYGSRNHSVLDVVARTR
jgi:hypothetical protein